MKIELAMGGLLDITAENDLESYALNKWHADNNKYIHFDLKVQFNLKESSDELKIAARKFQANREKQIQANADEISKSRKDKV
ncbi:MAG: hypothetical protein ACTSYO_07620 [Candidatus Ranarchaeia archaeon]